MKDVLGASRIGGLSAADLKEIVDAIPAALFVKDAQSRILLMNRRCEEQWGVGFDKVAGTDGAAFFPAEQMEVFLDADRQVFDGGRPISREEKLWNARQQINQAVHTTKSPTYHADGRPRFLIGVSIDIEQRKYVEARLQQSEETLRNLYELSPLGIARTNMAGQYLEFNRAFERICGRSREELLAADYWDLTPLEYQEQEQLQLEMLHTQGYYGPYEKEYLRKDGSRIPIRLNGVLTVGTTGEKYIWSIIEDITQRKQSEAALVESSEKFSYLVNAIPQMVWTASEDGELLFANHQLFDFLGVDDGDVRSVRRALLKALSPASSKAFKQLWAQTQHESKPEFNLEIQAMRKDGEYRWLDLHAVAIRNQSGPLTRWVGTLTDVSERRMADQSLRESQKLEAIGSLTGGLAHDFNNLLGIVLGNLDMLSIATLEPRAAAQVRVALSAAERGAELTKSLLAVARGQTSAPATTDLVALLTQLKPLLVHTAGVKTKLRLSMEIRQATALVDVAGLESSLLNLVINARDAMPPAGGKIHIVLRTPTRLEAADLPAGQHATIEIVDNGCGMSDDVQRKATHPFFTTKERGRGTGLGLAMVNGFAHQSGGRLRIESKLGRGTAVRLTLPLMPAAALAVATPAPPSANSAPQLGTVMIVDDEHALLDLLSTWLSEAGYRVLAYNAGEQAWAAIQQAPPDILITDVVMPGKLDGLRLAAKVAQFAPAVRILLVSGFPIDETETVAASSWPMLPKPYRRTDILMTIAHMMA